MMFLTDGKKKYFALIIVTILSNFNANKGIPIIKKETNTKDTIALIITNLVPVLI